MPEPKNGDGMRTAPWCLDCKRALRNGSLGMQDCILPRAKPRKVKGVVIVYFHEGCGGDVAGSQREVARLHGHPA